MQSVSEKLSSSERQSQITRYLMLHERITVNDIAELFSVTTETARKDLNDLQASGKVKRFHGGAMRPDYVPGEYIYNRMEQNVERKQAIAKKALSLIPDGAKLLIDSGSTNYYLGHLLSSQRTAMVITNDITISKVLAGQGTRTMIVGGEIFGSDMSAVGPWAELCLNNITADIAFIGASGLSRSGPSVENFLESDIKNIFMRHAKISYLVADSSKCNLASLVQFADWNEIDGLIIDSEAPDDFLEEVRNKTSVFIAE